MLAEALSIGVHFTMKNHLYNFNGEMRRQEKGGPIGLALTGDLPPPKAGERQPPALALSPSPQS